MGVYIENLQDKVNINDEIIKLMYESVEIIMGNENFTDEYSIDVMIVDNEKIREINLQHRNIDKPTDVLSFPIVNMYDGEIKSSLGDIDEDDGAIILGDIVISIEKAVEQALEYGHSLEREMIFLLTHGVYHLLGYDHDNEEREEKMLGKQNAVLNKMGLKRACMSYEE
ncbi:rRNA maturation RNase YbeY [Acetivibrio saccincola]|jgi:probable rRNA maturation factor|uniref:Endoribonuclease YbeY n=1 Tax=Acetivibrio saccincola TaxID=1677857 RepID=A0A2K9EHK2_9FIRM|nr:rRNA maturation RNase YbeY [Acetivibrio saccincola]AUG57423.1 Endoribonuclease YbeY [Acetivibrio saccincola]NLW27437.1 rRNA maturation RNase YbeY [Acetivibrio saccincola]PQQ67349.1 rRNA maturation RNase YbeY [Acetivibrio saccincola]HOA97779.1 rRNA maturation RNase YbeY [Acetivibrio saccincola]HQD29676.1 rRNA maturation RNase YbeY [Acetivibrio saccincola]